MSRIDHFIRQAADEGLQLHLWRTKSGYQANVKEASAAGWTVVSADDPIDAVVQALAHRATRWRDREVVIEPEQMDIEDAIASAVADDDEGFCVVCESGGSGCDACRPAAADDDDFGDLL